MSYVRGEHKKNIDECQKRSKQISEVTLNKIVAWYCAVQRIYIVVYTQRQMMMGQIQPKKVFEQHKTPKCS